MTVQQKVVRGPGWPTRLPEEDIDVWSETVPRGQRFVMIAMRWIAEPRPADLAVHMPDPKPRLNIRPVRSYWKRRSLDLDWRDWRARLMHDELVRWAAVDLETSTVEYLK